MRFFGVDQHISVVSDVRRRLLSLGHTLHDICLSGHAYVLGREQDKYLLPEMADEEWCTVLNENLWEQVAERHAAEWDGYDAYLCCFPPVFVHLYKRFNKPTLINIPIRYDYAVHSRPDELARLNAALSGEHVVLTANNRFDADYLRGFCPHLQVTHIPSYCDYTGMRYEPTDNRVLYYATKSLAALEKHGLFVRRESVLRAGYSWSAIGKFRAIVHIPYQVSTMSIFEQYTAGIPLWVPTPRFLTKLYKQGLALEQVSPVRLAGQRPGSYQPWQGDCVDPNRYDCDEAVAWWLERADYYQADWMANIQQFDSWNELHEKISAADFEAIHDRMMAENRNRLQRITNLWREVLSRCT